MSLSKLLADPDYTLTTFNGGPMKHDAQDTTCYCEGCCEVQARKAAAENDGFDIARRLADYVNPMGLDPKYFIAGMVYHTHRTLQQNFMRLCVAWFEHLSKLETHQYDLRNEASVKFAKSITSTKEWQDGKYLPHV